MIRAVLFDLDGTLLDTPPLITEVITAVLVKQGVPLQSAAAIRSTIGLCLDRAFSTLLNVAPGDAQIVEAIACYRTLYAQIVLPKGESLVFPGVREGLLSLRARGMSLAVATSKIYASAHEILMVAGLRDAFDLVVGADQVDRPKPDPAMAHSILDKLGSKPKHAVMVGDTTHDVLMAKQAGLRSIAVTYGVHDVEILKVCRPTWLAASFNEALTHIHAQGRANL